MGTGERQQKPPVTAQCDECPSEGWAEATEEHSMEGGSRERMQVGSQSQALEI